MKNPARSWPLVPLALLTLAGCAAHYRAPRPIYTPSPVYPEKAYADKAKGVVQLGVIIDRYGATSQVDVLREEPKGLGFAEQAVEAVRGWVWAPARQGGVDTVGGWKVTLRFDPNKTPKAPTTPVLVRRSDVEDPPEGVEPYPDGVVLLQVDVTDDGTAGAVRVVRVMPAGHGLAEAAVRCVKTWRWIPGLAGRAYVFVPFGARRNGEGTP